MPNYPGTISSGVATYAAGKFGQALSLSGTQYVTLPSGGPYEFANGSNWTWNVWVKPAAGSTGYVCAMVGSGGGASFYVLNGKGSAAVGQFLRSPHPFGELGETTQVDDGAWHMLTICVSGNGMLCQFFIDGVLNDQTTGGSYVLPGSPVTTIGAIGGATFFSGLIDEWSIYSAALYTSSGFVPPTGPTAANATNLVALYHLDGSLLDDAGVYRLAPDVAGVVLSPGNQRVVAGASLQWIEVGCRAKFNFTGTKLSIAIDASAYLAGSIASGNYPELYWCIDGGIWHNARVANVHYPVFAIATGLSSGTHTFEVRHELVDGSDMHTPVDAILLLGWILDFGATISAPTGHAVQLPLKGMIFGDSIVAGAAASILCRTSFASVIGLGLEAELGIVGRGGQGWARAGTDGTPAFPAAWAYYTDGVPRVFPTDLDYLYVQLGTNDYASGDITTVVTAWIIDARAKVGPTCWIIVAAPFAGMRAAQVEAGVVAYQAAYPADAKVGYIDTVAPTLTTGTSISTQDQYTADTIHLTDEGHTIAAALVMAKIKNLISATPIIVIQRDDVPVQS